MPEALQTTALGFSTYATRSKMSHIWGLSSSVPHLGLASVNSDSGVDTQLFFDNSIVLRHVPAWSPCYVVMERKEALSRTQLTGSNFEGLFASLVSATNVALSPGTNVVRTTIRRIERTSQPEWSSFRCCLETAVLPSILLVRPSRYTSHWQPQAGSTLHGKCLEPRQQLGSKNVATSRSLVKKHSGKHEEQFPSALLVNFVMTPCDFAQRLLQRVSKWSSHESRRYLHD